MGRIYWFALFLAAAIATHAAYVLSYPAQNFERKVANVLGSDARNVFDILPAETITEVFPAYSSNDVVAICRYDVSKSVVEITSQLPRGYWTLSIFTQKGRQLYSMTDTQAGDSSFRVELSLAPDIVDQVMSVVNGNDATTEITDASWRVLASEPKGVAIIWVPVADPIFRSATLAAIAQSKCGVKGG
jgi:uncharacterized membrane protein